MTGWDSFMFGQKLIKGGLKGFPECSGQGKDSPGPIKGFPRQDGIPLCFEEIKSGGIKRIP